MILTKTDKTIKAFEKEIKRLLKEGKTAKEAVKEAYKKYPVMKTLEKELQKQLEEEMKRGAGEDIPINAIHDALSLVWSPDNLTLSERTTKGGKEITAQAASIIAEAIKKGESVQKTALALFDGYGYGHILPTQDIPEFMKKLSEIGKLTDYKGQTFRKTLRDVERQLKRVNVQGMKIAYGKVKEAIETGNEKKINKAVYVATQERTRYFARRIARTELARAYGDGAMAKWENDEDCVAFQWKLSTGHPFCDICDLYAHADLYGMGPGIFPKDKVPRLPAHPNCMCHLRPVMSGSKLLKSETPKARIEEGGREWFAKQSLPNRQRILGVYGEKNVKAGQSWTEKARGYSGEKMKSRILTATQCRGVLLNTIYEDINKKHAWTKEFKEKCVAAVRRFNKRYGIILSDHASMRFVQQKTGHGKRFYTEVELIDVWKKMPNYKENEKRMIKFYNGLAVIYNISDNVVISIVVRKNAKKAWEVI